MKAVCFACKEPKTLTSEHVIPNSLGGRLKEKLYCKECNDIFGRNIDNEIAKQFGRITTILRVKRERGTPQPFVVDEVSDGTKLIFDGNRLRRKNPVHKIELKDDNKTLKFADVTAPPRKELEDKIRTMKKRYKVLGEINIFEERHDGPTYTKFDTLIDSPSIRRSVAKMAYSLLCVKLPTTLSLSSMFENVRSYIRFGKGTDCAAANFINTGFMVDGIRPLHKIHISFNRNDKIAVGYVSIFSIYRFTVMLSDQFTSTLELSDLDYTFDPVRRKEVFGKDNFRALRITEADILRPKRSKEFEQDELNGGLKMLFSYIDDHEFISGECE